MAVNVTTLKAAVRSTFEAKLKTEAVAAWGGAEADYEGYATSMGAALTDAIDTLVTTLLDDVDVSVTVDGTPGTGTIS